MLYVYVTEQCREDAEKIGSLAQIESLQQKLTYEQSTLGLERHPYPFLKKSLGRTRVIMAEVVDGNDKVLCFLRHVFKKDIEDYDTFLDAARVPGVDDPGLTTFLEKARATQIETKEPPSDLELEYLLLDQARDHGQLTVLESPVWISEMRKMKETRGKQGLLTPVWEVLQQICDEDDDVRAGRCEARHDRYSLTVFYRYFPTSRSLLLVAPLEGGGCEADASADAAGKLLADSEHFDALDVLRNAARAYPDFILYDREIWESTQASIDANLALSPEESSVLTDVLDPTTLGGFPLFINGRPGSGKSTILQYLFAEYLHAHLARPIDRRLAHPPLYLTYNERLLENARRLVEDIFHCGAVKLAQTEPVHLDEEPQRAEFARSFVYFREFLLSLLDREGFEPAKYIDFRRFKTLYTANLLQGPDAKLRRLAPEVAWHTLRTYIKGKNAGASEYFDPACYAELPRNEITVSPETFKLVWEKVWNGWYRILCEEESYWDDQDLARRVLDLELAPPRYPAIFCDEAQDFTTVELELIFRLSCFSAKRVEPHNLSRVPYAFAGDPFQTLNPTGFRWDAIKANFHDNIARQLDPDDRGKIRFTFKELAYNYRSTVSIVRFCNLIQLKRAELFDIRDVAPQTAWAIDKGAWPAYFDLDLGTQGKLKDQSELVIVVPCQEGEEQAFVEDDDYLKTIALDKKGEISRNVLSPMRAKGLEFQRVVLYKFGARAVTDDHVTVMETIAAKGTASLTREQTLGLEYFFNGVYVGASRAQRRLLVVDTTEGLERFWSFATDASAIEGLVTERRRSVWTPERDLHHMVRGHASTWSEDRDNPKALADRFFEQGKLEHSPYLLQLARNQYEALGDVERKERCTALIHDLEGEFLLAAASYERLGEPEEAIRCYWEGKAYEKISETAARDPGRFTRAPLVIAGRFMSGKNTAERASEFLKDLHGAEANLKRLQFKYSHWANVIQQAATALTGDGKRKLAVNRETAMDAFNAIYRMQTDSGLAPLQTKELALLAFLAGEELSTLEIWNGVKHGANDKEPEFIIRARARTTPYPQRLRWYGALNDFQTIVQEYLDHSGEALDDEYRAVVLKALLAAKEFATAIRLVQAGAPWTLVRDLMAQLPTSEVNATTTRTLLAIFLRKGVERGEFRAVIEAIVPGKNSVKVLSRLISDEERISHVHAGLLKLLARSQALVDERADDKFVAEAIRSMVSKRSAKINQLISPEEVGSALERAGRMDIALAFYESVFNEKQWGADKGTELNAKERWLKCKQRQAELERKDEQRGAQRLAEAKRRSAEWGIRIPDAAYPELKGLAPSEIEVLVAVGETPNESAAPRDDLTVQGTPPTAAEEEAYAPRLIEKPVERNLDPTTPPEGSVTTRDTSVEERLGVSLLPPRAVFAGRVDVSFICEGVEFRARLLPSKRRLELVAEASNDLVFIKADTEMVESPDLEISEIGASQWRVDPWSLSICLFQVLTETALVEITDPQGQRILCVAV